MCDECDKITCAACQQPATGLVIDPRTGNMEPSCLEHLSLVAKRLKYQSVAHLN